MEYVGQRNIKRFCSFYVSDVHLSVMLLPYLSRQIDEDVEITTIFEKNEKQNIENVLEKLNVKNKGKILNINWLNGNKDTNEEISKIARSCINKNKDNIIIICGDKKHIVDNNKMILKLLKNSNIKGNAKIIDCYNIEEVGNEMKNIVNEYDGILNTSGENVLGYKQCES